MRKDREESTAEGVLGLELKQVALVGEELGSWAHAALLTDWHPGPCRSCLWWYRLLTLKLRGWEGRLGIQGLPGVCETLPPQKEKERKKNCYRQTFKEHGFMYLQMREHEEPEKMPQDNQQNQLCTRSRDCIRYVSGSEYKAAGGSVCSEVNRGMTRRAWQKERLLKF